MDKGGGGYDTSVMEQYGNKALALQEKMYDEGVARSQPWYQTGKAGLDELSLLLGIGGGAASMPISDRQTLYDRLLPQYQSTVDEGVQGLYELPTGEVVTEIPPGYSERGYEDTMKPLFSTKTVTDTDALNAAINAQIAQETAARDEAIAKAQQDPRYGMLQKRFDVEEFGLDPSYQFRLSEGEKALERAAASKGRTLDPSTMKALTEYGQGLASQEYGAAFGRDLAEKQNIFNMLAGISGSGQMAGQTMSGLGQGYAQSAGDIYTGLGNAITSANIAKASRPSMFDKLLNVGTQLGSAHLMGMSDITLKENISYVDTVNGHNRYKFNYKGDDKQYIGVMAQEVEKTNPEAVVVMDNGYKAVNYDLINVKFEELN